MYIYIYIHFGGDIILMIFLAPSIHKFFHSSGLLVAYMLMN